MTFEFVDPQDFGQKPRFYSSKTKGVILDQDNNKHAGVYQGQPFPTVVPPTAPPLTDQAVDRTGDNRKRISMAFLRRKLDEFISQRNDPVTGPRPPLRRIHLSSAPSYDLPPESYADVQRLINANDGVPRYISNPSSLGQIARGWVYLADIDSAYFRLNTDPWQASPIAVTVAFKPGGHLLSPAFDAALDGFSITLMFTLDKATITNRFGQQHTVVDLMSWITELQAMNVTLDHISSNNVPYYRITGSFLHQPVNLVTPTSNVDDLFLDQVIILNTPALNFPGGDTARGLIRAKIADALGSARDGINSQVTSWLLGGVADDALNLDGNNAVLHDIWIEHANPELGIAEDTIVIDYDGPRKVFVAPAPAGWPGPAYDFSPSTLANIDHIVVLTKENRSFDHILGYLSLPLEHGGMARHDVDGLKGGEVNSYQGIDYPSFALDQTRFAPGPPNGYESVHHAINGGRMDGFVRSHAEANSDAAAGQIMGYHTGATVPVYDALARDFAIGHRWFASHPGPTFPNRFYELTGRPNLDTRGFWEFENSSPMVPVYTPTIFDYLNGAVDPISGAPVTWRHFEHGYCTLRFFERYTFDSEHIVSIDDPQEGFFARARSGRLPSVSFIDPHFVDYPPGSTCDEPPSDIAPGQTLIQRVVEAVVAGPAWPRTLLLIVYDEHGGFYDHVPPPAAARVSTEFPIATLGVRVPAFVISPWVAPGSVFGYDSDLTNPVPPSPSGGGTSIARVIGRDLHFDHTSILKTIARRFLSTNPPYMGARYAAAKDLSAVIGTVLHQSQFLPFITYRLQFVQSQMMLHAFKLPYPDPGAVLWQFPVDGTVVQDFSFEDAGDGFVYIRSHVSNLYVAAVAQDSVLTSATTASPGAKWKLSRTSIEAFDRNLFEISNQAYQNMVLLPANRASGSPVVLSASGGGPGWHGGQANTWRVSSPLLGDEQVVTQLMG